jgi:hypothetical protein
MSCPRCNSEAVTKDGSTQLGGRRFRCSHCGRRFTGRSSSAFSGRAFPDDIIALALRWICAIASVTPKLVNGWPSAASWSIRAPFTAGCNAICRCSAR